MLKFGKYIIFLTVAFLKLGPVELQQLPCNRRDGQYGYICVCNATYCDTVPDVGDLKSGEYQIFFTSQEYPGINIRSNAVVNELIQSEDNLFTIRPDDTHQTIKGFGGAFTDSTGINILSLSPQAQEKLLESYFGDTGVSYSLCRVPVGGTDFSTRFYTYCDEEDPTLGKFALQSEDLTYKIPIIQRAKKLRGTKQLELFASSWSSPLWTKTLSRIYTGHLRLKYYQLWANYYIRFFQEYKKHGLEFWGMTTQNEGVDGLLGLIGILRINAMTWLPWWMNNFLANYLGPTLKNSEFNNTKIMIHDDNRFWLIFTKYGSLKYDFVLKYLDGVALHWYTDNVIPASILKMAKTDKKDLFLLATEASYMPPIFMKAPVIQYGSWKRAAGYLDSIFDDIKYSSIGWVDWNLVLDTHGGPTYCKNYLDAAVIVNKTADEFYKQPMFYAIGHFSKYVLPGSVKLTVIRNYSDLFSKIKLEAFRRPDGKIVVVIFNKKESSEVVSFDINGKRHYLTVDRYSLTTFIYAI